MILTRYCSSRLSRHVWSRTARLSPYYQTRFVSTTLWQDAINNTTTTTNSSAITTATATARNTVVTVVRWKHAARKGNHLEVLDDMAHAKEREQAQERRQKKKERKLKKKGKKGGAAEDDDGSSSATMSAAKKQEDDHDDDDDHEDDHDNEGEDDDEIELPDPSKIKHKMMDIVSVYEDSLKSIRGAEPTPELFDDILVNAYDSENTPLKSVAQVVITSPTMAQITCFDPALVKEVRASIQLQLSLNPQTDGSEGDGVLKVPLPKVSLESRQKTAQQLSKKAEAFRKRIRRVRRRYNGIIKQGKEGKLEHISKDDVFRVAKEIDEVTEKAIKKLNDVTDKKHASIMDVQ